MSDESKTERKKREQTFIHKKLTLEDVPPTFLHIKRLGKHIKYMTCLALFKVAIAEGIRFLLKRALWHHMLLNLPSDGRSWK